MELYLPKMPKFVAWLYPKRIWAFSRSEPAVYLTFDDGPIPGVTPWVLEQLKTHNAEATFFCIGDNIRKHPDIFSQIEQEGHGIGNHTFHHLKGTQTESMVYLEDIQKVESLLGYRPGLFRPPYGKLTKAQAQGIASLGYQIVMWDVLSYDWDKNSSQEKCLNNVLQHIKPGSIVVFHDSLKAEYNMRYALPKVLEFINKKGWKAKKMEGLPKRIPLPSQ